MPRLARLSSALLVTTLGCIGGAQRAAPALQGGPPEAAAAVGAVRTALPDGDYACTLTSDGYTYQPYLCRVATTAGVTRLVKLEGSQRVRGTVTFSGDTALFHGEFYCNGGGCNRPVDAAFARVADSTWAGGIGGQDALQLVYAPGGLYGGAGYGADAWADDGYGDSGGGGYGGGGYGYGGSTQP